MDGWMDGWMELVQSDDAGVDVNVGCNFGACLSVRR